MTPKTAIVLFSQSEKIKAGIIWATHALRHASGMSGPEKKGAESVIRAVPVARCSV